jgi:hypothetical protein
MKFISEIQKILEKQTNLDGWHLWTTKKTFLKQLLKARSVA